MKATYLKYVCAILGVAAFASISAHAQTNHILNINFAAADADKVGFAAVGQTTNDFWNGYQFPWVTSAAVANLKWSDSSSSTVGVTVDNAPGQFGNPVSDGMYDSYIYPQAGGNITVTVTNLPSGTYDFYVYGHGEADDQNGIYNLVSDSIDYGTQSTTVVGSDSWTTTPWINGQQYVLFASVPVVSGQPVLLNVLPANAAYGPIAVINGLQIVPAGSLRPTSLPATKIMNLNFGGTDTNKTGFAAVGLTTSDFWNGYYFPEISSAAVGNLKWSDGSASTVGVTVDNAWGEWGNPVSDGMYMSYIYPTESVRGNITVTLTNLPAGIYDFYLYGHGSSNEQNGIFNLVSDSIDYGTKATTMVGSDSWTTTTWQEGLQYEVMRGVSVADGQPVTISVLQGVSEYAMINGLQIVPATPLPSGTNLMNINFGGTDTNKTGFAAVGLTTSDFWNGYYFPEISSAAVGNLKWSDGSASTVGVTVDNAWGEWGNPVSDGMYMSYIYPTESVRGNITVTLTNLPAGIYDFYLYGHGSSNEQNGIFNLVSDSIDYGTKATTMVGSDSWTTTTWQEGLQYEVMRGVSVADGQPVTISVLPGVSDYAMINGLQIVRAGSLPDPLTTFTNLMNVNFAAADTNKVGFAVIGQTTNDFWNGYQFPWYTSAAVSNLKWANSSSSTVGITVDNAPGQWGNPVSDGMFDSYIYNYANVTVTVTNLPSGTYDIYVYGHGAADDQNGIYNLVSNSIDYGTQATTVVGSDSWNTTNWTNGQQYVLFAGVPVVSGQPVILNVLLDNSAYGTLAMINGLQIAKRP